MYKYTVFIPIILIFLSACSDDSSSPSLPDYTSTGKTALVILVENNDGVIDGIYSLGYNNYRTETLDIFSELFNIPVEAMDTMSLNQIIETYGEDWQIRSIAEAGKAYYDTIIGYRNEKCSEEMLKSTLNNLSKDSYTIDMVFCLHGTETSFSLYDRSCNVSDFTYYLNINSISIRALYQTCCFGSGMIDDWQSYGIHAVNGSVGKNSITMFSPAYFIEEWTKGKTFEKAVYAAYNREIEKIRSYRDRIPVIEYILTNENLEDSKQKVGGINKSILWKNLPEILNL